MIRISFSGSLLIKQQNVNAITTKTRWETETECGDKWQCQFRTLFKTIQKEKKNAREERRARSDWVCAHLVDWMPSGWNEGSLNEPVLEIWAIFTLITFVCKNSCFHHLLHTHTHTNSFNSFDVIFFSFVFYFLWFDAIICTSCITTRSGCHTSCCQLVDECVRACVCAFVQHFILISFCSFGSIHVCVSHSFFFSFLFLLSFFSVCAVLLLYKHN